MKPDPKFTDHEGNLKHTRLDSAERGRPDFALRSFLTRAAAIDGLRVLDVGCGRGSRVAWLLENGWDAYGVDVEARYLEAGRPFFRERGLGEDRLRLSEEGRYPFEDRHFDVVLSDQVVEHVQNLPQFVREIARVSKPTARGAHVFPATFRPIEPHLQAPFVHWTPKHSALRRVCVRLAVRSGQTCSYFADNPRRAEIYTRFLDEETAYRRRGTVRRHFEAEGMSVDVRQLSCVKVESRLPRLPGALIPMVAEVYSLVGQTYLETTMRRASAVSS